MDSQESGSPLLRCYEVLESASQEMVQAARRGDWDSVCRLEAACGVVIARLRTMTRRQPLPRAEQPQRMRILLSIIANDAEVRRICEPLPAFLELPPAGITLH